MKDTKDNDIYERLTTLETEIQFNFERTEDVADTTLSHNDTLLRHRETIDLLNKHHREKSKQLTTLIQAVRDSHVQLQVEVKNLAERFNALDERLDRLEHSVAKVRDDTNLLLERERADDQIRQIRQDIASLASALRLLLQAPSDKKDETPPDEKG